MHPRISEPTIGYDQPSPPPEPSDEQAQKEQAFQRMFSSLHFPVQYDGESVDIQFTPEEARKISTGKDILGHRIQALAERVPDFFQQNVNNLGIDPQVWKQAITSTHSLLYHSPELIDAHVTASAHALGIGKEQFIPACLMIPWLFSFPPKTLDDHATRSAQLLGMSKDRFVRLGLRHPGLFTNPPHAIDKSIYGLAKALGIDRDACIAIGLKNPSLLMSSPETVKTRIDALSTILHIDRDRFVKMASMRPPILSINPETAKNRIAESVRLLGMDEDGVIRMMLKQPSLLYANPTTTKNKFDLINRFFVGDDAKARELIQRRPTFLNYAPERILASYAVKKIAKLKTLDLSLNPCSVAKKYMNQQEAEEFARAYEYLRGISEKKRRIRKRITGREQSSYESAATFIEGLFGDNSQPLQEKDQQRIEALISKIIERVGRPTPQKNHEHNE